MSKINNVVLCAHCNKEMTGCPCNWMKTSDNKVIHKYCIRKYEAEKNHTKPSCAYCGVPFKEPAYFKAIDGSYVHFKCQVSYDKELLKSKK